MGRLLNPLPKWLLGLVLQALNALWNVLAQSVLVVPDVTGLPQVQRLVATSTVVVNTGFVLVVITTGMLVMARETLQVRYGIGELAPRLVVAFVAANMATPVTRAVIGGANVLTAALTGDGITAGGSFGQLQSTVTASLRDTTAVALAAAIGLLIAVLVGILIVLWVMRLGLLVVLAGVAPLALACHSSPLTDAVARLWWRALLGTLGTVVLQAIALHAALSVFLDPAANLTPLGLPADPSVVLNLFITVCLLWTVVRIPGLMRQYVLRSGGRGVGGYVLRVLVVQRLTSGLTRALTQRSARGQRPGGGSGRDRSAGWPTRPLPTGGRRAISGPASASRARAARPGPPVPAGRRGLVARAGQPLRPYTGRELADGVDLYTQALKRRTTGGRPGRPAPGARGTGGAR